MNEPAVFELRTGVGGCLAIPLLFLAFPVMAVVSFFGEQAIVSVTSRN
ncbi:MAG: hypothetical protein IPG17_29115 [Sandaracinaceae bacterium]|jgi:hypothetical protein|nr:hypothetical protein [Sandaracinaceae bacterium]MBP7685087.1 hypothetical protein [Deltaproteobacteria bacterium]MBK6812574.1 hypothetical protein [Sandaracinaceae bacterium]MBK7155416.1 hypothetical protein [Sandaracinaceae bacterium]MBK7775085.1 hypothetical protein [Sandaracinaceae bacterium]